MNSILSSFIRDSRKGKPYISAQEQYNSMLSILTKYNRDTITALAGEWESELSALSRVQGEFNKLHSQNGGVVHSGDDGFYLDFANWLLGQGETLFYKVFEKDGHKHILEYVKFYEIPNDELTFENLGYAFNRAIVLLAEKATATPQTISVTEQQLRNIIEDSRGVFQVTALRAYPNTLKGYRITFKSRRHRNEHQTHWCFDIPLDDHLSEDRRNLLSTLAITAIILHERDGAFVSDHEFRTGLYAINLENNPHLIGIIIDSLPFE